MFTGIIETMGEAASLERRGDSGRLTVATVEFANDVQLGESVSVNGCCLTIADIDIAGGMISFDLLSETLRVTALGNLVRGDPVNLERAMRAGDRFGGHFLQGHVDASAPILALEAVGSDYKLTVALPSGSEGLVIPRGSVAVDGISLTVAELAGDRFSIWIIPHTWRATNLRRRKVGDYLNLEFDLIGKYVVRALALRQCAQLAKNLDAPPPP